MDYGLWNARHIDVDFSDFITFKIVFSNATWIIFGLESIRQVYIWSEINKLIIQSEYRKIGSFNQRVLASHAHGYMLQQQVYFKLTITYKACARN